MATRSILPIALFLLASSLRSQQTALRCAACHPKETRAYLVSSMGSSIGPPKIVPAGKVNDPHSGSVIQAEWHNGKLFHRLSEDGITAQYEIRYQIGAGKVGHSYAVLAGRCLLESPVSYYKRYGWDVSPGYSGSELLDFNRVLTDRCLFCHSNYLNANRGGSPRGDDLVAIGCERCHGESSGHLQHPSAATIVNPAKLPTRARDSVCEQCHLEGVARVLNPGKRLTDFKPGLNLETVLPIYVVNKASQGVRAVSQEEQLALSRCAIESRGKLWCGTCHNPHAETGDRDAEVKTICTSCHTGLLPENHSHFSECVTCHMPRRSPTDVGHAALTDHRILAKPESTPQPFSSPQEIRAWHEPDPNLQQRDLGLAYSAASITPGFEKFSDVAESLLKSLPPTQQEADAAIMAALGRISLSQGSPVDALPFLRRARDLEPGSGEHAMYLGIALNQSADKSAAALALKQAVQLDPSLQRSYLELSALDAKVGRSSEAKAVLSEYLAWNPQSILIRLTRNALANDMK